MQTYRVETKVSRNRTLTIKGLPFQAGEKSEAVSTLICMARRVAPSLENGQDD